MAIFYADYYNGDDANDGTTTSVPVKNPTALAGSLVAGDEVRVLETSHVWVTLSGTFTSDRTAHTISTSDDHSATLVAQEYIRVTYTDELGNSVQDYFRMSTGATSTLITLDTKDEFIPDGSTISLVEHCSVLTSNTVDMDITGIVGTEASPIKISGGWKTTDTTEPTGETIGLRKSTATTARFFDINNSSYLDIENFIVLGWDLIDNGSYLQFKDIYNNGATLSWTASTSVGPTLCRGTWENCTFKSISTSTASTAVLSNHTNDAVTFLNCRFISSSVASTSSAMFSNMDKITFDSCEFIGVNRLLWECYGCTLDGCKFLSNEALVSSLTTFIDDCHGILYKNITLDDSVIYNGYHLAVTSSNLIFENVNILNSDSSSRYASSCEQLQLTDCTVTLNDGTTSPYVIVGCNKITAYNCDIELKPSAASFMTTSGPAYFYDCTVTNPDAIPSYMGPTDYYRDIAFHRLNDNDTKHVITRNEMFMETLPDDTHSTSLAFKVQAKETNNSDFEIYVFVVTDDSSDITLDLYYKTDSEPSYSFVDCLSDGALIERYRLEFIEDNLETNPVSTGNSTADWCIKSFTIPAADLVVGKEIKLVHNYYGVAGNHTQFDFSPAT